MDKELLSLLNFDLDADAKTHNLDAETYYREVAHKLCDTIIRKTGASGCSFYTSGFEAGVFTQLSHAGGVAPASDIKTNDAANPIVQRIQAISLEEFTVFKSGGQLEPCSWDPVRAVFYLFSRGEIFGFIDLLIEPDAQEKSEAFFRENGIAINAIAADNAFAFRMNTLSQGFPMSSSDVGFEDRFGSFVADLVARGFGADGCTFRLFEQDELRVVGSSGYINSKILEARKTGEALSGRLFDSLEHDWAAIIIGEDGDIDIGGLPATKQIREELKAMGLYSVLMCRLDGEEALAQRGHYGTISYYFLRSTTYSRRDVALFRAFAKRLSSHLSLHYAYQDIHKQGAIIERQSRFMTLADISNLLSHDIWHRAHNVQNDANRLLEFVTDSIGQETIRGSHVRLGELRERTEQLVEAADDIYGITNRIRRVSEAQLGEIYVPSVFTLDHAIKQVKATLDSALTRKRIVLRLSGSGLNTALSGPEFLFQQVLFNIVINSIDSLSNTRQKDRIIEMHAHVMNGRLIIRITDNGPGITHMAFPVLQQVFELGKTGKKTGTGMGLYMARQFLGTHFNGQLSVISRQPPIFTIDVPIAQR